MKLQVRYANHPEDSKHYTTKELRKHYLMETVFEEDEILLVYSHQDRIVSGGVMPVNKALPLETSDELRAKYFLERRELGIINIGYPVIYVAVTGLFTVALNGFNFGYFLPAILSGGLMLGAIFMATDYTTTPNTTLGNIIYFVMLGLITAGLRQATHMEVVSFAILFMNLFVPLIDKFVLPNPFGYKKIKKVKGAK